MTKTISLVLNVQQENEEDAMIGTSDENNVLFHNKLYHFLWSQNEDCLNILYQLKHIKKA